LAIVANTRGAEEASKHTLINYLGFPLSISETFQQRNTNKSIGEALDTVRETQSICSGTNQVLVTYISMGFGNPYHDPYDVSVVERFVELLANLQVKVISLADTIGVSQPTQIHYLFTTLALRFPEIEFGAHLHSNPATAVQKIEAAYRAGCRRFDGAIKGFGGCPMAEDELVGNLATETILSYLDQQAAAPAIDREALQKAMIMADSVFAHG
jgi:hydroxymethylglutaryl-CoA lyase